MINTASQQVSWWSVHEFVSAALSQAEVSSWPLAGTPAWCALADGDPRKWAAVLSGGEHWALRVETSQEARAEASRDVAEAADWDAVSRNHRNRADFYAQRPWLKRAAS
jgi:Protein of unknown function (DUF2742)